MIRIVVAGFLLFVITGCGAAGRVSLREDAAGSYSFTVAGEYQDVYRRAVSHAQSCARQEAFGTTADVLSMETAPGAESSTILVRHEHAVTDETLLEMDLAKIGDSLTSVTVYYALHRIRPTALAARDWIVNDSGECRKSRVVVDCVCRLFDNQELFPP